MEKNITIAGKKITLREITFGSLCELEDLGFSVAEAQSKQFTTIRALIAFNMQTSLEEAEKFFEEALGKGAKMSDFSPMISKVTESDFFQKLLPKKEEETEEETPKVQEK